jgi:hypothetical protein
LHKTVGNTLELWFLVAEIRAGSKTFKRTLGVSFAIKIIMIMTWCTWKERNDWLFGNEDPSVEHCKLIFKEFALVIRRVGLMI